MMMEIHVGHSIKCSQDADRTYFKCVQGWIWLLAARDDYFNSQLMTDYFFQLVNQSGHALSGCKTRILTIFKISRYLALPAIMLL